MNQSELTQSIFDMEYAKQLHVEWKDCQQLLIDDGDEILPNAGDPEWHQLWIDNYDRVLKILRSIKN